jgi:hypothetical protein
MPRLEDFNLDPKDRAHMRTFGIDPDNLSEAEAEEWRSYIPSEGVTITTDWRRDAFEFGALAVPLIVQPGIINNVLSDYWDEYVGY